MRTSVGSTTTSPGSPAPQPPAIPSRSSSRCWVASRSNPCRCPPIARTASPPPTGADRTPISTKPYGQTCQPSLCSTVGSWPTVSLGSSAISPIAPGTAATPHCWTCPNSLSATGVSALNFVVYPSPSQCSLL